jgi:serine phosphatase RsbU (regulator of sigma subunit)
MDNDLLRDAGRDYRNNDTRLPPGSKLLLYTDGLTEAANMAAPGRDFEGSALIETLERYRHESCHGLAGGLYESLAAFKGSDSFDDDVCLICIDMPGHRHV